jgi:hypothetical protein
MIADRKDLLKSDTFRSLVFILLSVGVILGFIFEKIRKEYAILILGVLIVFDLWSVDKRYLNADKFVKRSEMQKSFIPSAADAFILKDPSYYRVLNLAASTFHKSIGGYHGAKMERYQELIDSSIIRDLMLYNTVIGTAKSLEDLQPALQELYSNNALNMLNTKYFIISGQMAPEINKNALGNAWFVEKPVMVDNANMEISAINRINPAKEAAIDVAFKDQIIKSSFPVLENEKIELVSYQPDELIYKYSTKEEKLVVFSEIYYPAGWKSYIDGKESKYFRANYVLRGMVVPAGDHEIKFAFKPSSYIVGNKISLASSIVLMLLLAGYVLMQFKNKSKSE